MYNHKVVSSYPKTSYWVFDLKDLRIKEMNFAMIYDKENMVSFSVKTWLVFIDPVTRPEPIMLA